MEKKGILNLLLILGLYFLCIVVTTIVIFFIGNIMYDMYGGYGISYYQCIKITGVICFVLFCTVIAGFILTNGVIKIKIK